VASSNAAANSESDINRLANGAWGERRYQQWNGPLDNGLIPVTSAHEFTNHEHLDSVELIHMNGLPERGGFLVVQPIFEG